ncbi:MAG: ATP-binding protein [Coriobacteriales bacterium]|jgi:hypothetical protein|nr:ATP-binding protein [Coriobacteriales bacterium]
MSDKDLIEFVEAVSGQAHLRVEENLGGGFVRLCSAEAERRQAKHDIRFAEDIVIEMLRNARDAGSTQVFVATQREGNVRSLVVIDDGTGVPPELQARIFEPRVTSKLDTMALDSWGVHGRGMALYSIKSNALNACVVDSAPGLGTALSVVVDTESLPERRDQSTWPTMIRGEDGGLAIAKGPHNIQRAVAEFALSVGPGLDVYLGTPAQIAATLMDFGLRSLKREELLLCQDVQALPLAQRLATTADAGELERACAQLGLDISERTAHRILAGQITAVRSVLRLLSQAGVPEAPRRSDLSRDSRGLKLAPDDLASFSRALELAFDTLAERYYLSLAGTLRITVKGNSITVRFPIEKD